jgi:hypothetical protein
MYFLDVTLCTVYRGDMYACVCVCACVTVACSFLPVRAELMKLSRRRRAYALATAGVNLATNC